MHDASTNREKALIGVSSCLVGQKVRFDGGHKRNRFIVDKLSSHVEFHPVCPEIEIGMGTPRETIRLVRNQAGEVKLVAPKSGTDYTDRMRSYAVKKVSDLRELDLDGYILKSGSPTCGMERVKQFDWNEFPTKDGVGLFAEALRRDLPDLPVEEEGRLNDAKLRENFFERVYAYRRVKQLFRDDAWRMGDLVRFHATEKLLLEAHDPRTAQALGRLVASAKGRDPLVVAREYTSTFMTALGRVAPVRGHFNVLQGMLGFFKNRLLREDRRELLDLLQDFRAGIVPLVVPLALLRHHVRQHEVQYLAHQSYLEPHPRQLALRNHVG